MVTAVRAETESCTTNMVAVGPIRTANILVPGSQLQGAVGGARWVRVGDDHSEAEEVMNPPGEANESVGCRLVERCCVLVVHQSSWWDPTWVQSGSSVVLVRRFFLVPSSTRSPSRRGVLDSLHL